MINYSLINLLILSVRLQENVRYNRDTRIKVVVLTLSVRKKHIDDYLLDFWATFLLKNVIKYIPRLKSLDKNSNLGKLIFT